VSFVDDQHSVEEFSAQGADHVLGQTALVAEPPHLIAVAGWAMLAALAKSAEGQPLGGVQPRGRATMT
jgi:hypothetical protein